MNKFEEILPLEGEFPSSYADRLGVFYTSIVSSTHKKKNGQFFTPIAIADLMASLIESTNKHYRILDPGFGTGVLSCILVEKLINKNRSISKLEIVVYETDPDLVNASRMSLEYLFNWLNQREIQLEFVLNTSDFVMDNSKYLSSNFESDKYDIIISNPPYFKLAKTDPRTIAASKLVSGQPNIYSLFMGIAAKMLNKGGQLVFITPRSYASGNYFKAFRADFFNTLQIEKIHLFDSRKDTFNRDNVLQETVIVKANNLKPDPEKFVSVSSSHGIVDIHTPIINFFKTKELIDLQTKEKILHLPTTEKEINILNWISSWHNVLTDYDIKVSTGPVVAFRGWEYIHEYYERSVSMVPLFWLHNVRKMELEWPRIFKDKGQYIRVDKGSASLLLPNRNYVLLRRFSTKDDKSRLIAAPFFSRDYNYNYIGIENKVNYIYRKNGQLEDSEVIGICSLLNSDFFDSYFQIFNGNVNVSATEMREMRFPSLDDIKEIGNRIIGLNDRSMEVVNTVVNEHFKLESILNNNE